MCACASICVLVHSRVNVLATLARLFVCLSLWRVSASRNACTHSHARVKYTAQECEPVLTIIPALTTNNEMHYVRGVLHSVRLLHT